MFNGPFDRGSGLKGQQRRGARRVVPPAVLPSLIKYRFCRTPLVVPSDFDPDQIALSARRPTHALHRAFVHGYNGLGRHNRSPNIFETHDGRVVYSAAALGVVLDPVNSKQVCFDGHTDDVTCIAVHRTGQRTIVATGQFAAAGSRGVDHCPWIAVWEAGDTPRLLAKVGWVVDDRPGAADRTRRPFYARSICSAAFSADGRLLVAAGADDSYTVGVWAWQKPLFAGDPAGETIRGRLVASAPTFKEPPPAIAQRYGDKMPPPAIHQIAIASPPLAASDAAPPFDVAGSTFIAVVGVAAAPRFGALSGDASAPAVAGMSLVFKQAQLGRLAKGSLPKVRARLRRQRRRHRRRRRRPRRCRHASLVPLAHPLLDPSTLAADHLPPALA